MNQTLKRISLMAAAAVLMAACVSAPAAPTQDQAAIQDQIQQAVSSTLAAQNAQATQQQALIAPSNTPLPTQTAAEPPTPTLELPTATPFVIVPPTSAPAVNSGGGGGVVIKPDYACDVVDQQPLDNSVWKRNKGFDINWTLVNTGTRVWPKGLDLKYYSGPQMTQVTFVELTEAVKPGGKYKVILDAVTPDAHGLQVMTWSLEGGFCYPYIAIKIE